jgi:hypothetical protein
MQATSQRLLVLFRSMISGLTDTVLLFKKPSFLSAAVFTYCLERIKADYRAARFDQEVGTRDHFPFSFHTRIAMTSSHRPTRLAEISSQTPIRRRSRSLHFQAVVSPFGTLLELNLQGQELFPLALSLWEVCSFNV